MSLIAILRAPTAEHFRAVAEALIAAGVRTIEVTLTTPGAVPALADLVKEFGDAAEIGAGTVLTVADAAECLDAGARFLVSPAGSPEVVAAARAAGAAAYPGALTPTEIVTAWQSGASAVKLFPASVVTPRYLADLRGPLPDIPIMPTGGIAIGDIPAWLRAGAAAIGLGGPLVGRALIDGPDASLTDRATAAVRAAAAAQAS